MFLGRCIDSSVNSGFAIASAYVCIFASFRRVEQAAGGAREKGLVFVPFWLLWLFNVSEGLLFSPLILSLDVTASLTNELMDTAAFFISILGVGSVLESFGASRDKAQSKTKGSLFFCFCGLNSLDACSHTSLFRSGLKSFGALGS